MTTHPLTVGNVAIRAHNGLYSLNDLHKASGHEAKHQPALFIRREETKALIAEIGNSTDSQSLFSQGGRNGGTYACRELVIAYASWISAAFHLKVLRVFLDTATPQQQALPAPTRDLAAIADQLATLNHQAVIEAKKAKQSVVQAHQRMVQAHQLADTAASRISQQVLAAVLIEDTRLMQDRWLIASGYDGKTLNPQVTRLERGDYVLTPDKFVDALCTGEIGDELSDAQWSELAQTALKQMARRAKTNQAQISA